MENNFDIFTISAIIAKYISGTLLPEEEVTLNAWREDSENNETLFRRFISPEFIADKTRANTEKKWRAEEAFRSFLVAKQEKERAEKRRKTVKWLRYAAIWLLPIVAAGILYFYRPHQSEKTITQVQESILPVSGGVPLLVLESGERIELDAANKEILSLKGIELNDTENGADKNTQREWRRIETPKSTVFHFTLSDGTKVCLNSGTTFEYLSPFSETDRTVRIRGEAFLAVAKSKKPFKAQINNMDVTVLGTSFNIRGYEDGKAVKVTLVSGRLMAQAANADFFIEPGQQLYLDNKSQHAFLRYVNVDDEISWMHSIYTFKEETLREVARVVEDWYDVVVVFESATAQNAVYTGVIKKDEDLMLFIERLNKSSQSIRARLENHTLFLK